MLIPKVYMYICIYNEKMVIITFHNYFIAHNESFLSLVKRVDNFWENVAMKLKASKLDLCKTS